MLLWKKKMGRSFLYLALLLILSNCAYKNYIEKHNLNNSSDIVIGSVKVYLLPPAKSYKNKNPKIREISHTCYSSDTYVNNSPFVNKRPFPEKYNNKQYLRFNRHGLFAISTNELQINNITCSTRSGSKIIKDINISLGSIKENKLNYIGDVKIYLGKSNSSTVRTTQTCSSYGGCTKSYYRTSYYEPKKITLKQDMDNTYNELNKIIQLPLDKKDLIYNKPKQSRDTKVKFSKDVSKILF